MKKKQETKTRMFKIEDLKGELLVTYTETTIFYPEREEDFHGTHTFSEDETSIHIDSVELVIGSEGIDITRRLSLDQQFDIIDALS
jgi:hypothetical protein